MKKQSKLKRQIVTYVVFVALVHASLVTMFAGGTTAIAQNTTYKVGDIVETMSAGQWTKAEILEIKEDGTYVIKVNGVSGAWAKAEHLRPVKINSAANNQGQNQTNRNTTTNAAKGTATTQKPKSIGERYGSREPGTCANTKAPARGAITPALAKKYLNCQMEYVSMGHLYLIQNLKVEVGGGIPYSAIRGQRSFSEINVRHPVYPIRGSFLQYQCKDPVTEHVGPAGKNCNTYNNPKASGYCYKTTFGDWKCSMTDGNSTSKENFRKDVAPPKR